MRILERAEEITEMNLVREESDVTGVSDVSPRLTLSLSNTQSYYCCDALLWIKIMTLSLIVMAMMLHRDCAR